MVDVEDVAICRECVEVEVVEVEVEEHVADGTEGSSCAAVTAEQFETL
jgi:hypothetical protein